MNEYLRRYARQNHKSGGVKAFLIASETDTKTILGFYSLSAASIIYSRTPGIVRRGLGKYDVRLFVWRAGR